MRKGQGVLLSVWNRLLWTILLGFCGLGNGVASAQCRFKSAGSQDVITYRFSSQEAPSGHDLRISMTFHADASTPMEVEIPSELISDLHIEGSQATLNKDLSGATTVTTAQSGWVTLSYRLRNGWDGPLVNPHQFQPVILPAYTEITGDKALIWLKRDGSAKVVTNFDWQSLPATWTLATSFGVAQPTASTDAYHFAANMQRRCQTYEGAWVAVNQALFAAGDFRLHPFKIGRRSGMLAVRGTWTFSDEEAAAEIGKTIKLVRDFWHDDAFPHFLVTLQPFDREHGSSDGSAFTNAFWMFVSRKDNINDLLSQLAHESFHAWNPLKMGYLSESEFEKAKWFKEGFTEYYAQKLTYKGGELSAQQLVTSINRDLLAFPSSSSEYVRGRIIALWLDNAITSESKGHHSLDQVMFRLVRDHSKPLTEQRIYTTIAPFISADSLTTLKKAADAGGDLVVPAILPGLGTCYRAIYGEYPTFDLGFNFGESRDSKAISGLDPSGPAFRAGLRNGQPVTDIDRGNVDRPATVTLLIDGVERKVSFAPLGRPVTAWQYKADSGKACSVR